MVLIVAECCVNFRDIEEAKELIKLSAEAGADIAKFQVYKPEHVAEHPRRNELINIILGRQELKALKQTADKHKIEFMATPFFEEAVDWLEELNVHRYKIRFKDRYNRSLYERIIKTNKPVYISCDFKYATDMLLSPSTLSWEHPIFCQPEYPPRKYEVPYFTVFEGYSNHFPSIYPPLIAVARGARYLEVHVKKDNYGNNYVPIDDAVSVTFTEFRKLVKLARELEKWL